MKVKFIAVLILILSLTIANAQSKTELPPYAKVISESRNTAYKSKFDPNAPYTVVYTDEGKKRKDHQAGDWKSQYMNEVISHNRFENKTFTLRGYYFRNHGDSYVFSRIELNSKHRETILCYFPYKQKLFVNGLIEIVKIREGASMDKQLGIKSFYCNSKGE